MFNSSSIVALAGNYGVRTLFVIQNFVINYKSNIKMDKQFTNINCYVDVETLPATDTFDFVFDELQPTLDDVPFSGSIKDETKQAEWRRNKLQSMIVEWEDKKAKAYEKAKEEHHKTGVVTYQGRIFCISYALGDGEIKTVDRRMGEKEMLMAFYEDIKLYRIINFVGRRVQEFDLLFILQASFRNGLWELANKIRVDHGNARYRDVDIAELACGGLVWKYNISLHNICLLLGIPTSKDEMDGSEVYDYYLQGRFDEIRRYCERDVDRTRRIYYKLK